MAGSKVPRGLYGAGLDGLGDPERVTIAERATRPVAQVLQERERRTSTSPVIRALQAATDRAFGRKVK